MTVKDYIIAAKVLRLDEGEFDESKHPRAQNGEFTSGEGDAGAKTASKPGKMPTYAKAKEVLFSHLKQAGWEVHTTDRYGTALKTPWAKNPAGTRFEFKAQAVHYGHAEVSKRGGSGGMLSTGDDIRTMSPEHFETSHRSREPFKFED